jgi:hypothetical protein
MSKRIAYLYVHSVILTGLLAACSSEPQAQSSSRSGADATKKAKKTAVEQPKEDNEGNACEDGLCKAPLTIPVAAPPSAKAAPPTAWCAAAADTQAAGQKLSPLYDAICAGKVANTFFVNTLISNAYSGSGEPQLYQVSDITNSGGIVNAFFAVAIKMPITIASHFESVAPRDGDQNTERERITAQGRKPGNVSVTPAASNNDKGWSRGWTIDSPSSAKAGLATVNTRYVYRQDHYDLGEGLFMYTSSLQKSYETVTNYQILTAGLDVDGTGYQVMVAKISAQDKGQAAKVKDAVKNIASSLVKFMYSQSTK